MIGLLLIFLLFAVRQEFFSCHALRAFFLYIGAVVDRNAVFPLHDGLDARTAEVALAVSHGGAGAAFYAVHGENRDAAVQAVYDSLFFHLLAAADDFFRAGRDVQKRRDLGVCRISSFRSMIGARYGS